MTDTKDQKFPFDNMNLITTPDDCIAPTFNVTDKLIKQIQDALPEMLNDDGSTEELSVYLLGRPSDPHLPVAELEKVRLVVAWTLKLIPSIVDETIKVITSQNKEKGEEVSKKMLAVMEAIKTSKAEIGSEAMRDLSDKCSELFTIAIDAIESGKPADAPSLWALYHASGSIGCLVGSILTKNGLEDTNYNRFIQDIASMFQHLNIDTYRDDFFALLRALMPYDSYGVEVLEITYRDTQPISSHSVLKIPATSPKPVAKIVEKVEPANSSGVNVESKRVNASGGGGKLSIWKDDWDEPITTTKKKLDDAYWGSSFRPGNYGGGSYFDPEQSYNMITERLAIGSARSRSSKKFKAILSAVSMGEFNSYGREHNLPPPGTKVLHCPMGDGVKGITKHLDRSRKFIAKNIQYGPVLIHCAAGISRSVSHTIAYLVSCGLSIQDAFNLIKRKRDIAGPYHGFIEEIAAFYGVECPKRLTNYGWKDSNDGYEKRYGTW